MTLIDKVNEISKKLITVGDLLYMGDIVRDIDGKLRMEDGGVVLNTIHEDGATIGIAKYKHKGDIYPDHIHKDSVQFIIQVKGRTGVTIEGGYRILDPGACMAVPIGVSHSLCSLDDGSEQIYINVPAEKFYDKNTNGGTDSMPESRMEK